MIVDTARTFDPTTAAVFIVRCSGIPQAQDAFDALCRIRNEVFPQGYAEWAKGRAKAGPES